MFAHAKRLVRDFWRSLDADDPVVAIDRYCSASIEWHGFQPIKRTAGAAALAAKVWTPLRRSFAAFQRQPYVLLGGEFESAVWVASTGDFVGEFADPWLGIVPTGGPVRFRYGRVEGERIAEIRMIVDLPSLLRQAGRPVLPPSYGRDIEIPGPSTGDGVLDDEQDPEESEVTRLLVEEMIFGGLNKYDQKDQDSQGLERFWHRDMVWHGPVGVGSALGLDEFKSNAQGPIVGAFPDRKGVGHVARIGDGRYAASTGWPSLVGTHRGEFLGLAPTGEKSRWNIMDFWRRDGDKLAENWVMIDLVDVALQAGVDVLRDE